VESKLTRRAFVGASAGGLGLVLIGGASALAKARPFAGTAAAARTSLSVGFQATLTGLTPVAIQGYQWSQMVGYAIYDPLFWRAPNGSLIPAIGTSVTYPNPNTTVIKIRQGVKFHDGTPLTAEDVAYSIGVRCDPKLIAKTSGRPVMSPTQFKSIVVLDDHTVQVNTTQHIDILYTPQPILIIPNNSFGKINFATEENGSGPFKVTSFTSGTSLSLASNAAYWDGAPRLSTMTFQLFSDIATEGANLRSGQVDALYDVSPLHLKSVQGVSGKKLIQDATYADWWIIQFGKKPLNDVRVRKALFYCFNKEQMNASSFAGLGKSSWNPFKFTKAFSGVDGHYPYDPEKAKALLKKAGASKITVPITGIQGYQDSVNQGAIIQAGFEAAGVKSSFVALPIAQWLSETYTTGSWSGIAFNAGNVPYPDKNFFDYMVDPSALKSKYSGKKSPLPAIAKLYNQVEGATLGSAAEKKYLKQAQKAIVDQALVYFGLAGPVNLVLPSDMNGVVTNGLGDVFWSKAHF
jgi:peptide/nickel transport system substrate-binding protein